MRRFLMACLAVLLPVSGAIAEERELLTPQDQGPMARSAAGSANMRALRQDAAEDGRVMVIVGLKVPFAPEGVLPPAEVREQREEIAEAARDVRTRFAAATSRSPQAFRTYATLPFMALEVTPAELERLSRDPDVISIAENRQNVRNLAQSVPLIQGDLAQRAGYTGAGQTIAILDDGVDGNHPFLAGKVVAEACYSGGGPNSISVCPGRARSSTARGSGAPCGADCDHGTHVAGIAAGSSATLRGVAPEARLIAIQVFSRRGTDLVAFDSDVIAGLQRVHQLSSQFAIAAANLSLGTEQVFNAPCGSAVSSAYLAAISQLKAAGIATVAASGNEGSANGISAPACLPDVVSVGSVSTRNWGLCRFNNVGFTTAQDRIACDSNSASFLSLLAPGVPIQSSVPGNGFDIMGGTSMAAPHVAGAWALIKQKSPSATVDQVLAALRNTGRPVIDDRNNITKPRINVKAALDSLGGTPQALSLVFAGRGVGSVAFTPVIGPRSCSRNCQATYSIGLSVTLTAIPTRGFGFAGWSGACSGTSPTCTVIMSSARSVTATFDLLPPQVLSYTKAGTGSGRVIFNSPVSRGNCDRSCGPAFPPGTQVDLKPVVSPGSVFRGWQGDCTGLARCSVGMDRARAVTATFDRRLNFTLTFTRSGTGAGLVAFTGEGGRVFCNGSCTPQFLEGSRVTLVARSAVGSRFTGWSGACNTSSNNASGTCSVFMTSAQSVTANFTSR
jgi:subtilisin family serine protease